MHFQYLLSLSIANNAAILIGLDVMHFHYLLGLSIAYPQINE
jgi:hypothetical protein